MKRGKFHSGKIALITMVFLVLFFPGFLPAQQRAAPASMEVGAAPKWNVNLGDMVLGQPHLQTESVVVACAEGSVKSFYITGSPLWNVNPNDAVTPYIARSVEGAAYICDRSGLFKAINRVGRELWRVNLGAPINYPPVVGWDGRVFIPVESRISCRTASGHPLWTKDLGSPMMVTPMLDHSGSVVTVLRNRDFVRISQFSSEERIRLDEAPMLIVSIKIGGGESYVLYSSNGAAEKINYNESAPKGSRLSRSGFPSLQAAPAAAAGRENQIAVTLRDGRVQLMDESGRLLWTGDSHETAAEKGSANIDQTRAAMIFDERGIYCLSTRGATGFAVDGRRRLIHKIEEAGSVPGFSDEGMLYVCGKDKILRAYKIDSKPRTVRHSMYYGPMPEGSYGMGHPSPSPWAVDDRRWNDVEQERMYALIERAVNSGQLGEDEPAYVAYLHEMIGFFLNEAHYSTVRPRVMPLQHTAFIRLLGRIGSRDTVPFLYNIFDNNRDPAIKAACAEAIGNIGVDPDGAAFYSYNFFLVPNNPNRDEGLLIAATKSIASLCRFSGPPLAGEGIMLLTAFASLSWAHNVQNQIRDELAALRREDLDMPIR